MTLKIGSPAPAFALPDQFGNMHRLKDYTGKWLLLYFYPKDDTPGCTAEACQFRDNFPAFTKLGIVVLGVSINSSDTHKKFAEKYKLPFTLLADESKKLVHKYGVWAEKKFMGRTYMGTVRSSFLINPSGIIAKIYPQVKPATHAEEVLADIKELLKNN